MTDTPIAAQLQGHHAPVIQQRIEQCVYLILAERRIVVCQDHSECTQASQHTNRITTRLGAGECT